jgi:hypothetical protein
MRTLTRLLVSLTAVALVPGALRAQATVGAVVGRTESRQLLDRDADSDTRTGYLAGGFVEVQTPAGPLSVLAEAFLAQRGGTFAPGRPDSLRGEVQADMLGFTVAPLLHAGVGPVSVYGYAGPMVEMPVRTRSAPDLSPAYRTPAGQIFAVTAGAGVGFDAGVWSVRLEARVVEELSNAYSGDAGDFRHRAKEILVRVGRLRLP